MKLLLIVNPKAGMTKGKTALFDIVQAFCKADYEVTCAVTQSKGHATTLAKEAEGRYDLIVCCGGDGTLNEVVTGIMEMKNKIPLGYIPAGTTNDFANSTGISTDIKKAVQSIIKGEKYSVDMGMWNKKTFSYIASFGAFTAVSYKVPQSTNNIFGHMAYIFEGIADLGSLRPYHIKLESEEKNFEGDYIFGAISNSTSIGGIVKLDEKIVDMNDGFFEVALIKFPKNPGELNRIVWGIINSDFKDTMFEFFKASEVKITMDEKTDWTLDGENAKGKKEIVVKNIKDAITIIK